MFNKRKALFLVIGLIIIIICSLAINIRISENRRLTAHGIEPGKSFDDNPLKGFVPFSNSYTDFPHSLEWFYIPMSSLYPDPDSTPDTKPDFAELEKQLNVVAERGNQAVFRVYIDYPTTDPEERPTGIPKFLRKEPYNLITHDYSEFGNYTSQIPDYSDMNLRKTIQNCILALGEKYDGDGRIAFVTGGFLGFWGEWHCWPYNGTDRSENYEPSVEVFNEVIGSYEKSFKKTKVLLRYPKGKSAESKANFGFHDDSYCFETAPVSMGGEAFNFGEILKKAKPSLEERWKTAPVGGELRPEIQATIFESEPWTGAPQKPKEKWDDNLKVIRPSWLINEGIKGYGDKTREAAVKAANQMGYDLNVVKAYFFDDVNSNEKLKLEIDIRNVGIAPFYYDHTLWPVKVGVKQNNELVASWTTRWDLNAIPADGKPVSFKFTAPDKNGLEDGYYSICMRVENPLPNGNKLGFANEYQYDDGWLDLGMFTVGKGGSMTKPAPAPKPVHQPKPKPKSEVMASEDLNSYEAEAKENTLASSAKEAAGAKCSGGKKVGYIGNDAGTLQFNNVKADKDGAHTLSIYYTSAEPRAAYISVNGELGIKVEFEPTITWTKIAVKDLDINLKAGVNTIKISNEEGWAPDIDRISIK